MKQRLDWNENGSVKGNLAEVMPKLTRAFFAAGRGALEATPEHMHEFRLAAKQFRYTLEFLEGVYGKQELKPYLAAMKQLQDSLGEINDCATTRSLLQSYDGADPQGKQRLGRHLTRRMRQARGQFQQFWREQFDKPGEEERWVAFLGGGNGGS